MRGENIMTIACLDFFNINPSELASLGKLALACLLGGVLGLEREMTHHPAGLRTHMLVALGSAGFMLTAFFLVSHAQKEVSVNLSNVMQGIITGMGFIGAGAIMKEGFSIHGLTTAASLWVASAVGLMIACGALLLATSTTGLALIALLLSRPPAFKSNSADQRDAPIATNP